MKRTTARVAATVAGIGALTGLAVGAAHADEPATGTDDAGTEQVQGSQAESEPEAGIDQGTDGSDEQADEAPAGGAAPNYVLEGAPGLPIGDPVSNVFSVSAPAYGVLGALG